jgi:hypothetical protein
MNLGPTRLLHQRYNVLLGQCRRDDDNHAGRQEQEANIADNESRSHSLFREQRLACHQISSLVDGGDLHSVTCQQSSSAKPSSRDR